MHHISVILHPMGMYYTILETGDHGQNDGSKIRLKLSLSFFAKSPIGAPLCGVGRPAFVCGAISHKRTQVCNVL